MLTGLVQNPRVDILRQVVPAVRQHPGTWPVPLGGTDMQEGTNAFADPRKRLGAAIRRARGQRSQTHLADQLGCPQSSVSMWENGHAKLSPAQVNSIEAVLGLPTGSLLVEAGHIDPALCPRSSHSEAGPRRPVRWRPPPDTPDSFPERTAAWLDQFQPLVEAICVLRTAAYDEHALDALLNSQPVLALRLGWELWAAMSSDATDKPAAVIEPVIGGHAYRQCCLALWGGEPTDHGKEVRRLRSIR